MTIISRFPLKMAESDLKQRYKVIERCSQQFKKLYIQYNNLKNNVTTRVIHPYKCYIYNNTWYVLAWDEKRNDMRYFKLNRIEKLEILNEEFNVMYSYNERNYLDEFGMKENGEYYRIRLLFSKSFSTVIQERIYGKNQNCVEINNGDILLEVDMQNIDNIVSFILSFGKNVKVLHPQFLIDRINCECKEILNRSENYEN